MNKRLLALIPAIALAYSMAGCSDPVPPQTEANRVSAQAVASQLQDATEIVLKKKAVSIGREYKVKINGKTVAKAEGMDLKVFGDVIAITSEDGGLVAGETEQILKVKKTAEFFDADQQVKAVLTKDLFSFGAKYHLKTGDVETAMLDQKFSFGLKASIRNANGQDVWKLSRKLVAVGDEITLTKLQASEVSATDAILMAIVANEIYNEESDN